MLVVEVAPILELMLIASDFNLVTAQTVVFTPEYAAFSVPKLLACVLGKYAELYDGDVQTIPLPELSPPDFPRVILQSQDGNWRLQASPSTVSSFSSFFANTASAGKKPEEIVDKCTEVLTHYLKTTEARVNRIALVFTWMHKTESSAHLLIEKFCKPELQASIFNKSQNFEVHSYEKTDLGSFSTNVWMRCKTAELMTGDGLKQIIAIEQDINTLTEETTHIFSVEEILEYVQLALFEMNRLLQLYFPN